MCIFSHPDDCEIVSLENLLQKRLTTAAEIADTLSQINIKKISVNTSPDIYQLMFHKQTTETRLEHIMKHFNTEVDGNSSVREALVNHFNLTHQDLDSNTKHVQVLFDFIKELTDGEFADETIVYRRFQPESQDHTTTITYWHLPTNIVVHTYLKQKYGNYNVKSCYVRHSEIKNCEEMMNGKCAFTGLPLNLVSLIPSWFYEMMFPELTVIRNPTKTSKPKELAPIRELPKFISVSKPSKSINANSKSVSAKQLVCA